MTKEIDEYLSKLKLDKLKTESTKRTYYTYIKQFFKFIKVKPNKYFDGKRDYSDDLLRFMYSLDDRPPKTKKVVCASVKKLFKKYDIVIRESVIDDLKDITMGRAISDEFIPTIDDLRKILSFVGIKGQTLFMFLLSSGCRIGEACEIKLENVRLTKDIEQYPTRIWIPAHITKTKVPRYVFVSSETTEKLRIWIDSGKRQAFLNKHNAIKNKQSDKLFPYHSSNARKMWNNAVRNAGFDGKDSATGRNLCHPHVLRKIFRTKMASAIGVDYTEFLLGHKGGYLGESYFKPTEAETADRYLKGEHVLHIFKTGIDPSKVEHLEKEVDRLHEKTAEHDKFLDKLDKETLVNLLRTLKGDDSKAVWDKLETMTSYERTIPPEKKKKEGGDK
jgi:integrase